MDTTVFDVTELADVGMLDSLEEIELFNDELTLDSQAQNAGTIAYELLTQLGPRYDRRYISEGEVSEC